MLKKNRILPGSFPTSSFTVPIGSYRSTIARIASVKLKSTFKPAPTRIAPSSGQVPRGSSIWSALRVAYPPLAAPSRRPNWRASPTPRGENTPPTANERGRARASPAGATPATCESSVEWHCELGGTRMSRKFRVLARRAGCARTSPEGVYF